MTDDKQQETLNLSDLGDSLPPAAAAGISAEDKAGLLQSLKDKLRPLAGSSVVWKRVEVLREIQSQHDELEAQFFEERAALEAKYQKLYEPLYAKRYEIVNGIVEVVSNASDSTEETPADANTTEEKGVPYFWLTALKTNEVLTDEIQERDDGALKFLKDIKWSRVENPKGFKLEFYFDTNPYFKNSVLTKIYHMIDEDDPILEKAIGTEIEWFPGKCLTQKLLVKKPKKGSKNTKPITKTEKCESFFNFFSPPDVPEDDDDIDEEAVDELQSLMEQDYDIGSTIRDKIIPHAVSWFTGEAADGDDEIDGDEELEGIDEDDDEDEDEDEDEDYDDEDEDDNPKKNKSAGDVQQGDRPADCKQQ